MAEIPGGKLNKLYVGLEAAIIFRKRYSLKSVLRKIENIKGLKNAPSSTRYEKGTDTMIYFYSPPNTKYHVFCVGG